MAAQSKLRKPELSLKRLTGVITAAVFLLCLGVVGATAWFIYDSLNAVGTTGGQGNELRFRVDTIDTSLLETIEKRISDKTQQPEPAAAQLHNPFEPSPAPSPAAPPAPPAPAAPAAETPAAPGSPPAAPPPAP